MGFFFQGSLSSMLQQAGHFEFLLMFANKYAWHAGDLNRYTGMPEKEGKYIDLLECLGPSRRYEFLEVPEIRAFYERTGWYHPGHESQLPSIPSEFAYGL